MTYTIELLPKARLELRKAYDWYEERQAGLGAKFVNQVFEKLDFVQANPLHYQIKNKYREALTDVFPYLIVYKVLKQRNHISVVSIFHTSRHPRRK